ncbi:MAG: hypothetical protein PHI86_00745, partial [Candidatus Omnitrophica bacterium]|nr:hypothetical protein [Candidatus Omnitrophota bacterium]
MKTIKISSIVVTILLLLPIVCWAAPKDYLDAEGSSYGIAISQQARVDAMKSRAARLIVYQNEIANAGTDTPEMNTAIATGQVRSAGAYIGDVVGGATGRIVVGGSDPIGSKDAIGGATGTGGTDQPAEPFGRFGGIGDITPAEPNGADQDFEIVDGPGTNEPGDSDTGSVGTISVDPPIIERIDPEPDPEPIIVPVIREGGGG